MQNIKIPVQLERILEGHAKRVKPLISGCNTTDQTKISLISPYLEYLGYNTGDHRTCKIYFGENSIHANQSQNIDYIISNNNRVLLVIEASPASITLPTNPSSRLQHHFSVNRAKYAILTNGVIWKWYGQDPDRHFGSLSNQPVFEDDIHVVTKNKVDWLYNTHPNRFDQEFLDSKAKQNIAEDKISEWLSRNIKAPDREFILFLIGQLNITSYSEDDIQTTVDAVGKVFEEAMNIEEETNPINPIIASPKIDLKYPFVENWIPLREYKKFRPKSLFSRGMNYREMEIKLPDETVSTCTAFRHMARIIIDWVNQNAEHIPQDKNIVLMNSTRIFGNANGKLSNGGDFRSPYRANRLGITFELHGSAENMVDGIHGILSKFNINTNAISLRSPRKQQ